MKLVVAEEKDSTPTVAFRLIEDGDDINVFADEVLVGWFETDGESRIRFSTALISSNHADRFARDSNNHLVTI